MTDNRALNVIAEAAASIEHSRWGNRIWYLCLTTTALIVLLGVAIFWEKGGDHAVTALAVLVAFCAFLTVVTPSAEQVSKMLAQVAAIKAGGNVPDSGK